MTDGLKFSKKHTKDTFPKSNFIFSTVEKGYFGISFLPTKQGAIKMNKINLDKINGINKEEIINPQRYTTTRKMTKEVLENALSDALIKIDKLWEDVHGNFPSEASKNNIYEEMENAEVICFDTKVGE